MMLLRDALRSAGNLSTAALLLSTNLIISSITYALRLTISTIDLVCGSGEGTQGKSIKWFEQRYSTEPVYAKNPQFDWNICELDSAATLKQSTYPIPPEVYTHIHIHIHILIIYTYTHTHTYIHTY
jgi:hypothetical protein